MHRGLWWAALVEAVSLLVLLANLVTVHLRPITQLTGPVHGCAYLAVLVLALAVTSPGSRGAVPWLAVVPGVGGGLVLRALARRA